MGVGRLERVDAVFGSLPFHGSPRSFIAVSASRFVEGATQHLAAGVCGPEEQARTEKQHQRQCKLSHEQAMPSGKQSPPPIGRRPGCLRERNRAMRYVAGDMPGGTDCEDKDGSCAENRGSRQDPDVRGHIKRHPEPE
ncbi:MAG: hypothetical protein P8020_19510, partial [Acidobacteriota bacterium]